MRYDPSLFVERLLVTSKGAVVVDLPFSLGVNIIRGANSSGKSVLMNFIFFGLGGDFTDWQPAAERCDFVFAQVRINGESITLKRPVSDNRHRPMSIFWGPLEEARREGVEGWQSFPFAARGSKDSFSKILFRALGIPEVYRSAEGSLITMHQILRLIYVDQVTPFNKLFVQEEFDSSITRQVVGDLLLGVYEHRLYISKLRLRKLQSELTDVKEELRGIRRVLGESDTVLEPELIAAEIQSTTAELEKLQSALHTVKTSESELVEVGEVQELKSQLLRERKKLIRIESELEELDFQIEDRREFITSLEDRLEAIEDSDLVQTSLGQAVFNFCPSCYAPINDVDEFQCALCKSPSPGRSGRFLRLQNELAMQLEESRALQDGREAEQAKWLRQRPDQEALVRRLQSAYDQIRSSVVTEAERQRAAIHRKIGYLERQLEDLNLKQRLAEAVGDLEKSKANLINEVDRLQAEIESLETRSQQRLQEASDAVSRITAEILREDLPRQRAFQRADWATFDFGTNEVAVDDRTKFGASATVYLKNAFHFALLLASTEKQFMNYPRLVIFDNVEDKGMEAARSHNFQELVVRKSEAAEVSHQIIMSTSMISPVLRDSEYVVGPNYSLENPTLDFEAVES